MLAAFDVDMWRIHGYSNETGRICYNASEWPIEAILRHTAILIEIASAVDTSKGKGKDKRAQIFNRRRWGLANMFQIGQLLQIRKSYPTFPPILVSPANKWTKSYSENLRELIAGCAGEDNHDIRACRSMLQFYAMDPMKWIPVDTYLENL